MLIGRPDHSSAPMFMELQIASGSPVVELPPLRISRARTQPGEAAGALGYVLQRASPGTPMDQVHHVVALVDGAGPAAAAGLVVGDEIVSIDGHDVTGASAYLYRTLTAVPVGTTVQIGLARGATIAVTAGKRP